MREDLIKKIYDNDMYLYYLRYNPKWYQYLDQDPNNFDMFEKVVKKEYKLTTSDKLEKFKNQINFASAFLKYISK